MPAEVHRFIEGDIFDPTCIKKVLVFLKELDIETLSVVHLISMTDVGECEKDESSVHRLNVDSLDNIFALSHEFTIRKIIFPSSTLVYGTKCKGLVDEDSEIRLENVYTRTKREAEEKLSKKDAFTHGNIEVV